MLIQNEKDQMFHDALIDLAEACTVIEFILEDNKIKDIDSDALNDARDFIERMDTVHSKEE